MNKDASTLPLLLLLFLNICILTEMKFSSHYTHSLILKGINPLLCEKERDKLIYHVEAPKWNILTDSSNST